MKIITVCGSLKYMKEMMDMAEKMAFEGNCVLTPIYNPSKSYKEDEIIKLRKAHIERIKISDAILVVDVDGYVGNATKSEIEFAKSLNKEIIYYTDLISHNN